MNILIAGCTVLPMTASEADAHKYFTGNIGIADGRIAFAGADPQQAAAFRARCGTSLREIDGRGKVAMPGLVNLHNHVSMSLMRSYADDMPLMPWLTEKIWPFEAKLDGEDIYLGARLGIAEMLLGGTTTFVDMYWHSDRVADAVTETGIRGVVCPTFVGASYDAFEPEALRMAEKYASGGHDRVQIMLAPHAPYTCPPETLKKTLKIAEQYGLGIQIHISETLDEQQTIREQYGKTPVEVDPEFRLKIAGVREETPYDTSKYKMQPNPVLEEAGGVKLAENEKEVLLLELFPLVAKNYLTGVKKARYQASKPKEEASAPAAAPAAEAPKAEPAKPAAAPITGNVVTSPMPGRILKVLVAPGDTVSKGQDVVILEAMKMENSIMSDYAGTVKQVLVAEGETVAVDSQLVEIE